MADQSTLKALRNKLSDLEDELDTAHEAQAELEKQVGQLKSDLEAKEEKLQSALTEAKDASERCASSEARLQKLSEAQDAPAEASSPPDSADQSEEVARLRAELQELQRSLKTSQMETKKLEEELKTAEQQQKEEKKRAEGLTSEIQQLQRSQQETAQAEAQKLKAVEAEHRNECQRLQQLCQELESDRDTALERMQRAEETLKQQMQQFQEFSKKNAAEARAGAEAMGKELEARNARIAQQQAELQRQAQAMAEEQRKAQELQEQLTAYVGTHQELFTRFQSAVEQLDSKKELSKAVALEREELRRHRDEVLEALKKERDRAEKEHQDAEQARQDLANAEPPGPAQLAVSDVLISVSFKEVERPLQVKPWDTNFEEVVGAWLHAVQRSEQLQSSLVRYLKHLEETSTAYPLHQDAKLLEVHEQFADAAF